MYVTIQEATKLTGRSRATISRHINSGKLSKTDKGIDTAELMRVYRNQTNNDECTFSLCKDSGTSVPRRTITLNPVGRPTVNAAEALARNYKYGASGKKKPVAHSYCGH